jgi:hypothetical protein
MAVQTVAALVVAEPAVLAYLRPLSDDFDGLASRHRRLK